MSSLNQGSGFRVGFGVVGLLAAVALFATVMAGSASAAEINLTTLADGPMTEDGVCTLREAVEKANTDSPQTSPDCHFTGTLKDDTINLPAGRLKIGTTDTSENSNARGDFDVFLTTGHGITINGAGRNATVLDGDGKARLFDAYNIGSSTLGDRRLILNNLTITGGDGGSGSGGGVRMVSAISDDSRVILNNTDVVGNTTSFAAAGVSIVDAILQATDSSISENTVVGTCSCSAAGIGGSTSNSGQFGVELTRTRVSGNRVISTAGGTTNRTRYGAGLRLDSHQGSYGYAKIVDSTISDNTITAVDSHDTSLVGAGIYIADADLDMQNSTVSGNHIQSGAGSAPGDAAGIYYADTDTRVNTFKIANSTIANNDAGADGPNDSPSSAGGLQQNGGTGLLVNSTFTGNRASQYPDLLMGPKGGGFGTNTVKFRGNILADPNACASGGGFATTSFVSAGDNIEVGGSTCNLADGSPAPNGDRENATASALNLGPLRNNGGPTRTAAPGLTSIAVDQIPAPRCLAADDASPLATDQRGLARTAPCDIGAVEQTLCQGRPVNTIGTNGDDNIEGTSGEDVVTSLDGDDVIRTAGGSDAVCAGDGDDVVDPGSDNADDQVDGGGGTDEIRYASAANPINADLGAGTATGNGNDTILGFENLVGTDAADTLTGTAGPNTITGLGGADTIFALAGADVVLARDGESDSVDCGADNDTAQGDIVGMDTLTNCETSDVQEQPPAGGGNQTPPGGNPSGGNPGATTPGGGKKAAKKCKKAKGKKAKKKCKKKGKKKGGK